jgi:hypothetical protein
MSPSTTGTRSPPGLAASRAAIGADRSIPDTSTPRAASGSATRPVPTASSSAAPPAARWARKSTVGPSTAGTHCAALVAS